SKELARRTQETRTRHRKNAAQHATLACGRHVRQLGAIRPHPLPTHHAITFLRVRRRKTALLRVAEAEHWWSEFERLDIARGIHPSPGNSSAKALNGVGRLDTRNVVHRRSDPRIPQPYCEPPPCSRANSVGRRRTLRKICQKAA